ncbi:MAG: DEAD/DEAH box helicase [Opitutales bacterium]
MPTTSDGSALDPFFAQFGWEPFEFQREAWAAYLAGRSGLVHAPTGLGKTYAALGGPVHEALAGGDAGGALRLVWMTPLRALANDTAEALRRMIDWAGLPWAVDLRHGDVSGAARARQKKRLPEVLVTTPESLTLLLSYPDAPERFRGVGCAVCDEWHELLGTKRGVQAELALARLRRLSPAMRTWGLSATLGNLDEALAVLVGGADPAIRSQEPVLIRGQHDKEIVVETLLPEVIEKFPWAGHLGTKLVEAVVAKLHGARSTLIFTNTRSQAELWHQSLLKAAPELHGQLELHHGSLDRDLRRHVEARLDAGELRGVVCTSSLDLGVDFTPVEQVIQIGSPKGVARLTQRAGRSGHQPGAVSRLVGVPTNALEIIEFGAARDALARGEIESRRPVRLPLDVLVQHIVTTGLAGHTTPDELLAEVRSTFAFAGLHEADWQWALEFVTGTGGVLEAYPEYAKVAFDEAGKLVPTAPRIAKMHRMGIGTIASDTEVTVKMQRGAVLGNIEERFVSMLTPGDVFHFAGRKLELVRMRGMVAEVRKARPKSGPTPTWQGGRSPLSTELAVAVSRQLRAYAATADAAPRVPGKAKKVAKKAGKNSAKTGAQNRAGADQSGPALEAMLQPETRTIAPLLDLQHERSRLPSTDYLLVEYVRLDRTSNLFVFPFAGRLVNEGLAALFAFRLTREAPLTLKTTVNDYGFSLQCARKFAVDEGQVRTFLSPENLAADLLDCMNTAELARRQFREIARVAGLVFQGYPGQQKSAKQLQMSSGLLYDVFAQYDPGNRLVEQAKRELLDRQLEQTRLRAALERCAQIPFVLHQTEKVSPMAFPLYAEALHDQVSSESWHERAARLAAGME